MGARNPDVETWLAAYENPLKPLVVQVRDVLLDADDRIGEVVKWSTPTFVYRGNLASFQPRAKQFVSLLFHAGASIPGHHPVLQGGGDTARYVRIEDETALDRDADALRSVVRAWCDARDSS
jgi:hypothetical protein